MRPVFGGALQVGLAAPVLVVATWWLVGKLRQGALRRGLLDLPNPRSSHARPTPRIGGVAILVMVSLPGLLWSAGQGGERDATLSVLVLLGLGVGLVSLLDDLRELPPLPRLGVHLAAAYGVVQSAGTLGSLALPGGRELGLGLADWPLSLLWIVGCINAFNFMDGIDGMVGGQTVVLGVTWLVIGLLLSAPVLQVLGLLLATSAAGFLFHNWAPARVFMGDVGSAFLGYWAAVVVFCGPRPGQLLVPAALIIWPFLFDTILTLLRRMRRGERLLAAHRGHLYQRLVDSGLGHARVALAYLLLAACGGLAASFAALDRRAPALWAAALLPAGGLLLLLAVARRERAQGGG